MARLDEICRLNMGQSPDSSSYNEIGDGLPFFQGNADFGELHPKMRIWCNAPTKIAHPGDILISVRAPIGALNIADRECCIGRGLAALTVNEALCNSGYLWYAITNKVDELNSKGTGSTFKAISKNVLGETEIPLPSLDRQQQVSATLDKLTDLISLRKQQLTKLDELVKTRFVEMFGDYRINNKGFECFKGSELFKFSSGKFLPEEKRKDQGIPVYGGNGIAWYTDECLINYPTIIIGRVGAQCGNIHLVTEPVWISDNAIYIKEQKTDKFCLEFLSELMIMMDFYQYADFSGQPKITQKPLESMFYLVPSVKLQEQFSDYVEKIKRQKLTIQQSLDKLEVLKKSLMQEYFG